MVFDKQVQELYTLSEADRVAALCQEFTHRYGNNDQPIYVIASPARINIIGEHIDYNGGNVFPAAINRYLYVLIRKRSDTQMVYDDIRFPGKMSFSLSEPLVYNKSNGYINYLFGMLSVLKKQGLAITSGFETLFFSTLPAGGGISSSSALEIGFGHAIATLFSYPIDGITLAKAGQTSEHEFMSVNCGIMDQFSIAMGKKDMALLLDTSQLSYEYIPLELGDYCIAVINSNKLRKLTDSKYNERRSECEKALAYLQKHCAIEHLCELSPDEFIQYEHTITDAVLRMRARHCVFEQDRVMQTVAALKQNDLRRVGQLLNESHRSLKELYEVTGLELDTLQEIAVSSPHCLGARMTGAGFGGCAIAVVKKAGFDAFVQGVQKGYTEKTGLHADIFPCTAGDGTKLVFTSKL